MIFALMGGDERSLRLLTLLRADGHTVRPFALERQVPDCAETPAEALEGASAVILPLPCERDGALNAPFSENTHLFPALLSEAPAGLPVLAGKAGENLRSVCRRQRLALSDYFLREDLLLRNADLTAEGAVRLLLEGDGALGGSRVLVVGFGRIGRLLAEKLRGMGVSVTVAARKSADRVLAECLGFGAILIPATGERRWDAVVNTVPATLFGAREMEEFGEARLIELASPPYGFDLAGAGSAGKRVELASGLPGKTAPQAAAAAVRDAVYAILEE